MVSIALAVGFTAEQTLSLMTLPLLVGGVCIITSIIGTYMVRLGAGNSIMGALYKGFLTSAVLAVPAIYFATQYALGDLNAVIGGSEAGTGFTGMDLFWCMMIGLALTGVLVWVTEYRSEEHTSELQSLMRISYA